MLDANQLSQNLQNQIDDLVTEISNRVLGQNIPFMANLLVNEATEILSAMEDLKASIDQALDGLGQLDAGEIADVLNALLIEGDITPITVKEDGDDLAIVFEFEDVSEIGGVDLDAGASIGVAAGAFGFAGSIAADITLGASFVLDLDLNTGDVSLDAAATDQEFTLQIGGEIDFDIGADNALGFLDIDLTDNDPSDPDSIKDDLSLLFSVDLKDGGDPTEVSLTGTATLDANIMVAAPEVPVLPEFGANVFLQVSYSNDDLLDDGSAIDGDFTIELRDVQLKLEALASVLQSVFSTVSDILNTFPLGEIVDIMTARLPVVDDLAPKSFDFDNSGEITMQDVVTFISIISSDDGPSPAFGFIQGVILLAEVIEAVDELADGLAEDGCFDIGTLRLTSQALDTISSGASFPDSTRLISSEDSDLANLADLVEALGAFTDYIGLDEEVEGASTPSGAAPLEGEDDSNSNASTPTVANMEGPFDVPDVGLSFPFLDSPENLVQALGSLLLNGAGAPPITLIEFDLPPLEFSTRGEIGINFGPFIGYLFGTFYAGVDVNIGYDTAGFGTNFDFAEGLFISPDLPEVMVNGETKTPVGSVALGVGVGGGLDIYIARVAVEGGLLGTIDVFLGGTGPGDNKARLSELGGCFFNDIAGRITAGIDLVFKFGFGIFSFEKRQSIATVTLAQFNIDPCNPPPTEILDQLEVEEAGLADVLGDGALTLNVGGRAGFRSLPEAADAELDSNGNRIGQATAETFFVGMVPEDEDNPAGPGELAVFAFGIFERFGDGSTELKTIVGAGGSNRDTLTVSASVNLDADLSGGGEDDIIVGGGGNDLLRGDEGNDQLDGDFGKDTLEGGIGNDILRGGEGADSIDGGLGFDQIDFSTSSIGISLVESSYTPGLLLGYGGEAQGDRVRNVEHFIGSSHDDVFYGNRDVANVFESNDGNDLLIGGNEGDMFIGGRGADILRGNRIGEADTGGDGASYVFSKSGVLINLATGFGYGVGYGGDAQGDLLFGIEDAQLSRYGDRFIGDAKGNLVDGYDGSDILEGGAGRDTIDGGVGNDTVYALGDRDDLNGGGYLNYRDDEDLLSYEKASGAMNANLSTGNANLKSNIFFGDSIAFAQSLRFNLDGTTSITSFDGSESIKVSSFENLTGSSFDDDLTGDDLGNVIRGELGDDDLNGAGGDDTLIGGFGADTLRGGRGIDTADYRESNARVLVDLNTGASSGHAQGDEFEDVENLIGSRYNDVLNGNELDNRLDPYLNTFTSVESLTGREGTDVAVLDFSRDETGANYLISLNSGGTGNASRTEDGGPTQTLVTLNTIEELEVFTQEGTDFITSQMIGDDIVNSGGGNDLISVGDGSDQVDAGAGDDFVVRQSTATLVETVYVGAGERMADTFILDGGRGIDSVFADISYTRKNIVWIGEENDGTESERRLVLEGGGVIQNFETLIGLVTGFGNDSVGQYGEVNNVFSTKEGADLVITGLGNDIADGGTSSTGIFALEDVDTLVVDYSGLNGTVSYTSANTAYQGTITFTGADGADVAAASVTHRNFERILLQGTDFGGQLVGSDSTYFRIGQATPGDIIQGGAGRDLIQGLAGDDTLIGGDDSDTLQGGEGDDVLIGGVRNATSDEEDVLVGGLGADLFVIGQASGNIYNGVEDNALISDFNVSQGDRIQLAEGDYTLFHFDPIILGSAAIYVTRIIVTDPESGTEKTIATVRSINEQFSLDGPYVDYVGTPPAGAAPLDEPLKVASEITDSSELTATLWQAGIVSDADLMQAVETAQNKEAEETLTLANMAGDSPSITATDVTTAAIVAINAAIEDFAVEIADFDGFEIYNLVAVDGAASASGTFENMFGLDEGFVLSTGRVSEILGENTEDGLGVLGPRPASQVGLEFEVLGGLDGTGTLYRALVPNLPGGIESLSLQDDGDLVGGATGYYSAFDLDAVFLSKDFLAAAGDLTRAEFNALSKVGAIEYSAGGITFSPGYMRPSVAYEETDLNGTVNGMVNFGTATLDVADASGRDGNMSFGDGGLMEFNLTAPVLSTTDDPTYLYVYEIGAPENIDSVGRVSDQPVGVAGDLSTDLGAPGIAGDTTTLTSTFTVDFTGANGPLPGFAEYTEVDFFDVVVVSEELPERGGAEIPDLVSVRVNGVDVLRDGQGDVVTLNTLANTPFGDFAPELTLNLVADGPKVDEIRADAYTSVYRISGPVVNGVNTIEVTVSDQADGLLDTAIFIAPISDAGPAANNAPVARNDSLRVDENGTDTINVISGVGIDTDADGDQLKVGQAALIDAQGDVLQTINIDGDTELSGNRGTVEFSSNGTFTFKAGSAFNGLEANEIDQLQFRYQVSDGSASDTALISVIVDGVGELNDAPVFTSDIRFVTRENDIDIFQAKAVDNDGPQDVTYSIDSGGDGNFFEIDSATGEFNFIQAPDFEFPKDIGANNVYSLQIRATDGLNTASHDVQVLVRNVDEPCDALNQIVGTDTGDLLRTSRLEDCIITGLGVDEIISTLSSINGDHVQDFSERDTIRLVNTQLTSQQVTIKDGSAIFEIELAGAEVSFVLEGDYSGQTFEMITDGPDTLISIAGEGSTKLSPGGERFITTDEGVNRVYGDTGEDVIGTAAGADILSGGGGADVMLAGAGEDTLIGGTGADRLTGGADNDVFSFSASDFTGNSVVADFITDFEIGRDRIELSGFGIDSFNDVKFLSVATGDAIALGNGAFIVLEGIDANDLRARDIDIVEDARAMSIVSATNLHDLTDANDRFVTTDTSANEVFAGAGIDAVIGGDGNDVLFGQDDDDLLIGGRGNDRIIGGQGADRMTGREGADSFEFKNGEETGLVADFITDFESDDTVVLDGFGFESTDEFSFLTVGSGDLALRLTESRFVVFEGISEQEDLKGTFEFV